MRTVLHRRRFMLTVFGIVVCAVPVCASEGTSGDSLTQNGSFAQWDDDGPTFWKVELGARNGTGPMSRVEQADGPALRLRGDGNTKVWNSVSQDFHAEPGNCYRLSFDARAIDLRRDPGQFDNAYVGLRLTDADGQPVAAAVHPVVGNAWSGQSVTLRVPDEAVIGRVVIFLSKSGTLEVRDVRLDRFVPEDSFALLAAEMGRHYSFFTLKGVDWNELTEIHRAKAEAAEAPDAFVDAVRPMLAKLKDMHVFLVRPAGELVSTHSSEYRPNFNYRAVAAQLEDLRRIGKVGLCGRTVEGFGYLAVASLSLDEATMQALVEALESMLDAPGLIIDIRGNGGGDENRARQLVGLLAREPVVYAQSRYRAGRQPGDFGPLLPRRLDPVGDTGYDGPIVGLIGPGSTSSGEAMAMMLAALPNCTLIGLPTRGASGNPQPLELPNGVVVYFSRWQSLRPDGTLIEGRGVEPDVTVAHEGPGDPAFLKALQWLRERIRASKP